jgi:spore coat polysaccharide biosynthesis predicted glycosyltransferase SpsG
METFFGMSFFGAKKVILDQDIKIWTDLFSINHTLAWQALLKQYLDANLKFLKPKLYLRTLKLKDNKKRVAIIVGVDKKEKRYPYILDLLENLKKNNQYFYIYLIGVCDRDYKTVFTEYNTKPFVNLINKQSYMEVVNLISSMDVVIGTEGSLIHVSTTIGVPTIIIEFCNQFWKYSNLNRNETIQVLSREISFKKILSTLNRFVS